MYKKIDLSQCGLYFVSEECAKALIDWRIQIKKGINQRVFDNALKQALQCTAYGMTAEEALDRWMESGWTGMKWVLKEAQKDCTGKARSTRDRTLAEDLTDRSWH